MFWVRCRCSGVVAVVLDKVQVLWIGWGVLDKVRLFMIKCLCFGVVEGALGMGAGVLDTVRLFCSGYRCSG